MANMDGWGVLGKALSGGASADSAAYDQGRKNKASLESLIIKARIERDQEVQREKIASMLPGLPGALTLSGNGEAGNYDHAMQGVGQSQKNESQKNLLEMILRGIPQANAPMPSSPAAPAAPVGDAPFMPTPSAPSAAPSMPTPQAPQAPISAQDINRVIAATEGKMLDGKTSNPDVLFDALSGKKQAKEDTDEKKKEFLSYIVAVEKDMNRPMTPAEIKKAEREFMLTGEFNFKDMPKPQKSSRTGKTGKRLKYNPATGKIE